MYYSNFIVFEGIDGSGKSTQKRLLHGFLTKNGQKCLVTEEPTSGAVGLLIRKLLSDSTFITGKHASSTLACLFAADRYQHLYAKDGVEQSLNEGITVICDRYLYSSLAYQADNPSSLVDVYALNEKLIEPDLIFYFDIDVSLSLSRMAVKQKDELEKQKNLEMVQKNYERLFFSENSSIAHKVHKINASDDVDTVHKSICEVLQKHFEKS